MLKLAAVVPDKSKTLTVQLGLETLAEFSVAAQIFRARSVSSFVHEYVVRQINEARKMVPVEEFGRLVEERKQEILERGNRKRRERLVDRENLALVVHARSEGEITDEIQTGARSAQASSNRKRSSKASK